MTAEELVRHAHALRTTGDAPGALRLYRQALTAYGAQDHGRAHCLRHIGDLAGELGNRDEARAALLDAENLYRGAVPDALALANTLRLRALLEGDKALWREARSLYDRIATEKGLDLATALAECDAHLAA